MAETLKKTDVVVIGLGAGGGTAVLPLARAGLKIVGLEAGPRLTARDFQSVAMPSTRVSARFTPNALTSTSTWSG